MKQNKLLLAAEAEVEENFQCEKADILAQMESNFQTEKWNLVAEAMSRTSSATYSAKAVRAQYERLKSKSDDDPTGLPRRTDGAVEEIHPESTALRPDARRLNGTSDAIITPTNGAEHQRQKVPKSRLQLQIEHSERMRRVWAKRRAQGTDGRGGMASKKARKAATITTLRSESSSAPVTTHQSAPTPDPLAKRTQPIVSEQEAGRAANQHRQSLAQIIPTTPQSVDSGLKQNKPSRKASVVQTFAERLLTRGIAYCKAPYVQGMWHEIR